MPFLFELSAFLTQIGFASTAIVNTLFIYMTIIYIKKVTGAYKVMVLVFSLFGIIFSAWELIARPFAHNYNKALMYFSLNSWLNASQEFLQVAIILYASFYLVIVAILAVQFIFRLLTLCSLHWSKKFDGVGVIFWITYSLLSGAIYGESMYFFCDPDQFSDDYMRDEILDSYNMSIGDVPRYLVIPYAKDGSIRGPNLYFLILGVLNIGFQYSAIIYCGALYSTEKATNTIVVVQTLVPTFLFVLPIAPFLIGPVVQPFFGFEINFQTGWVYIILCLFPPIDTIAFMLIVSEYKKVTLEMLRAVLPKRFNVVQLSRVEFSTSNATK